MRLPCESSCTCRVSPFIYPDECKDMSGEIEGSDIDND